MQEGATAPAQHFHWLTADLTSPSESARIIAEATALNNGAPPDIVWCCAGSSHPTLFVDTPIGEIRNMMDQNYFTAAYMAHAALHAWLKPSPSKAKSEPESSSSSAAARQQPVPSQSLEPRHLIFTASFLSFFTMAGYAPYSPSKAALRSLSDSLSQEMHLYASPVRLHTIFPATIFTESFDAENRVKSDLTKKLEEGDPGQTADEVAAIAIQGLEKGEELVTTTWLTRLVMTSALGGSVRNGWAVLDTALSWVMGLVLVVVRRGMDAEVRKWGREHGESGTKRV